VAGFRCRDSGMSFKCLLLKPCYQKPDFNSQDVSVATFPPDGSVAWTFYVYSFALTGWIELDVQCIAAFCIAG